MSTRLPDALKRLEALGNDKVRKLNIRKLADSIKVDHDLALAPVWIAAMVRRQE